MSWIVETLLNNRENIRAESNIDSDEFNDILIIEKAIKELREGGVLSDEDLSILNIKSDSSFTSKSRSEKQTLSKKYVQLCERIAYYIGDYFTEEGYLNYIQKKYGLSSEQVNVLLKYIKSEYKHKIIRKPIT